MTASYKENRKWLAGMELGQRFLLLTFIVTVPLNTVSYYCIYSWYKFNFYSICIENNFFILNLYACTLCTAAINNIMFVFFHYAGVCYHRSCFNISNLCLSPPLQDSYSKYLWSNSFIKYDISATFEHGSTSERNVQQNWSTESGGWKLVTVLSLLSAHSTTHCCLSHFAGAKSCEVIFKLEYKKKLTCLCDLLQIALLATNLYTSLNKCMTA